MKRKEFDKLLEQHYRKNQRALIKRCRGALVSGAEDVLHDAVVKALQTWETFNPEIASFGTWFDTIIESRMADHNRRERKRGMTPIHPTVEDEDEGPHFAKVQALETLASPISAMEDKVLANEIQQTILRIDNETSRKALTMWFVSAHTYPEIMQETSLSKSALSMVIQRFKNSIREAA